MSNTTFLFCQTVTSENRIAKITLLSPRKFVRGAWTFDIVLQIHRHCTNTLSSISLTLESKVAPNQTNPILSKFSVFLFFLPFLFSFKFFLPSKTIDYGITPMHTPDNNLKSLIWFCNHVGKIIVLTLTARKWLFSYTPHLWTQFFLCQISILTTKIDWSVRKNYSNILFLSLLH